jgi:hypothetical protein
MSKKSIVKHRRVEQYRNAKVFPGLVGYHAEPDLRDVKISITKKNNLKTLALKRKMSMSGDISLHTIFDPSLTKSELKNINHLAKFRQEARMSRSASAGKIIVKYPKHELQFRYTNNSQAKTDINMKNPFRGNFKTAHEVRAKQIEDKIAFNYKILGHKTMRYTKDRSQNILPCNRDELDNFVARHQKHMKNKTFGKGKSMHPPLSKKREKFNRTFNRLLMSKSMSFLQ